jgi:NhaP-type Na+/H+ or K+/H+ antiporter
MHDHPALIFTALLIFLYGLFSHLSERWAVTGPMVFMGVGVLASPLGLDLFELDPSAGPVKLIAEITLIMILFVDATLIKHDVLLKSPSRLPMRLLLIGLPLTMLFGTVAGVLMFPETGIWAIALMALILSPTDAALGQAVIKSKHVPDRIRQTISVESGLNDGIALPPIFRSRARLDGADLSAVVSVLSGDYRLRSGGACARQRVHSRVLRRAYPWCSHP